MTDANKSGKRFNIVLAVLIAVMLWFYVVNVENPTGETSISAVPVTLSNVAALDERGLMVTDLSRDTVNLKASGKRKSFLKLYKSDLSLSLDVSAIEEAGEHRLTGKVLPDIARIDSGVTLSEKDSFAVTVTVKKKEHREIPVKGEFHGTLAGGFDCDPMELTPSTIELSGPEDLMEQVSHAVVVFTGEGIKESIEQEMSFVLLDQNGNVMQEENLHCSVDKVQARLPVVKLYEIPLHVTLKDGGGTTADNANVSISPATIKLSGPDDSLKERKEINLGEIDLAEVFNNKSKTFAIPLPDGTKTRGGETEATVTVTVDLPMKSIAATQISLINVPKGYTATLTTDSLQVWVRGKQEQLDQVTGDNLRVVVDLAEVPRKRGQQRVEAKVSLEGIDGVGVLGTDYSLAVSLK